MSKKNNVSVEEKIDDGASDEYYELYANQDIVSSTKNPFSGDTSVGNQLKIRPPLGRIEYLHDIELQLVVRFGQIKMTLKDILNIRKGRICILNKIVGEPVEVYVGNRLMARGEVVVVNERFGVRLSEIVRPDDRGGVNDKSLF